MYKLLLALHLVFAVFAIGPLVHAATTAGRGIRTGNGTATASAARLLRIYGYASVLVVASGLVLMRVNSPSLAAAVPAGRPRVYADYLPSATTSVGEISQTWIWLSLVLWVLAIGIVLGNIVPTLDRATSLIAEEKSVVALTARVAAAGGVVGLMFLTIVVLMVYRPGR